MNTLALCLTISIIIMGLLAIGGGIMVVVILSRGPRLVFTTRRHRPRLRQPAHRPALADGLDRIKCLHCSGGTQWHDPAQGVWGPIPQHLLFRIRAADGDFDCRPPLHTGLRRCESCAGFGAVYRDKAASPSSPAS